MLRVGIVADTHDLLRPELLDAFAGVDHILHLGDICSPQILTRLAELAPLHAVRGNNDRGPWAEGLPEALEVVLEDVRLWLCHDRADLRRHPPPPGTHRILVGHSHAPKLEEHDGVPLLNPGSAGRRRFRLPVSCALMQVDGADHRVALQELPVPPSRPRRGQG